MKVWVVFEVAFFDDGSYRYAEGLGSIVAACLDGEQAHDEVRRRNIAWWRAASQKEFDNEHSYDCDRFGLPTDPAQLDDDQLAMLVESAGSQRFEVRELDVTELLRGDPRAGRVGLGRLLRDVAPDAARALEEDA